MPEENTQSTTIEVNQFLSAKLQTVSENTRESVVVSVDQDSPVDPYLVQIRIVPVAGGSGSLSTQSNALAAQIINALNLTKATVQPIANGDDGKAFMTLQAEYQPS
jgi:hypothetical protein